MTTALDTNLSTAQIANKLGVGVSTVNRWFDDGQLPGYRVGRVRRVTLKALVQFLKERSMPFSQFVKTVMAINLQEQEFDAIEAQLKRIEMEMEKIISTNLFEIGGLFAEIIPACIIIGTGGDDEYFHIAEQVAKNVIGTPLIAVCDDWDPIEQFGGRHIARSYVDGILDTNELMELFHELTMTAD